MTILNKISDIMMILVLTTATFVFGYSVGAKEERKDKARSETFLNGEAYLIQGTDTIPYPGKLLIVLEDEDKEDE